MRSSLEFFIALRYLRPRRGQWFVSLITFASTAGIALCVAALIVIISVMNGFGNELRERLVSLSAHVTVTGSDGTIEKWQPLIDNIEMDNAVVAAAPFVEGQGMIVNRSRLNGTIISGVLPETETGVSQLGQSMVLGSLATLTPGGQNILLDSHLAYLVEAAPGDKITIMIPRPSADGRTVLPLMRRFTVSGIFNAGLQSASTARSVIHLEDAVALFGLDGEASGVRIKIADLMRAPAVSKRLESRLQGGLKIDDWTRQQASYFRALKVEKVMMSLFLLLAVGVAAFNINAMLMMVVSDKRNDIAVLRTFGLSPARVTRIFLVQGAVIAVAGVLIGLVVGVIGALNVETAAAGLEQLLGRKMFNPDVYYVTNIPSEMRWSEVLMISLASLLLALSSTVFPSRRAAAVEPAEALRYE
ncbi:MAG: lipoprotein-releasing ABC transporter permease subunit [Gammaproteobacteria bacterium]